MKKDINEALFEGGDDQSKSTALPQGCTFTKEQLKPLHRVDNQHNDNKEGDQTVECSRYFIEELGGIDGLFQGLNSSYDPDGAKGIDAASIEKRKAYYGRNEFPPPKIKGLCEIICENFDDPINRILLIAAIVSSAINLAKDGPEGLTEGASIAMALLIIIVVGSTNNYIAEKEVAKQMASASGKQFPVFRNSDQDKLIDGEQLVVGDIYAFKESDALPADSILIDGTNVSMDESDLTGEPLKIHKTVVTEENLAEGVKNTLFGKTMCTSGNGLAIVTAVGDQTQMGIIQKQAERKEEELTLLQRRLHRIANSIGNLGTIVGVLVFISLVVRIMLEMTGNIPCGCMNIMSCQPISNCTPYKFDFDLSGRLWTDILQAVIVVISVIVCAVPEGLPLAVTISLSSACKMMRKENALVRQQQSAETMGGATYICSDKTGTLTQNNMTVMAMLTGDKVFFGDKPKVSKEHADSIQVDNLTMWQLIQRNILWNKRIDSGIEFNKESKKWITKGNATEKGMMDYMMKASSPEDVSQIISELKQDNVLTSIEFSSKRKKSSIVVHDPESDKVYVFTKGAPDYLLFQDRSREDKDENSDAPITQVVKEDGSVVGIEEDEVTFPEGIAEEETSDSHKIMFEKAIDTFAKKAYRTIMLAYREMSKDDYDQIVADNNDFQEESDKFVLEEELTAIGLIGIEDPLREGIRDVVELVTKQSGITVVMCTGDAEETAKAIATNAGILTPELAQHRYACMTGSKFEEMTMGLIPDPMKIDEYKAQGKEEDCPKVVKDIKAFRQIKQGLRVLARSTPEQKLILVTGMKMENEVVAVTGDGTNDTPAVAASDIGFAMNTGSDILKNKADMILLDDNFCSIVVAIKYGRNVYDNVRKFLQYQLSVNVVAMAIVFFGSVFLKDSPMNAVQILWVNMIMDTFGALALATEPPSIDILYRKPYNKTDGIMTLVMWRNVIGHSIFQCIILAVVIFGGPFFLTNNYWALCTEALPADSKEQLGGCKVYNPYFTNVLYMDEDEMKFWTAKQLTASNFDQELLKRRTCEWLAVNKPDLKCDDSWTEHKRAPTDMKKGDMTEKLLHYTLIFNVFVFLQVWNLINARKLLADEFNVFSNFCNNPMFFVIFFLSMIVQIVLIQVGGNKVKTYPLGLEENAICVAIGAVSIVWGALLKLIPVKLFSCFSFDDKPMTEEESESTLKTMLKPSSSIRDRSKKKKNTSSVDDDFEKLDS